ncbi:hypothetical protein BC941DRAFT_414179 [Chlamydoabsidia padenii]|nr:hypothetical protein BC941DRAFT_414179 [Chlamydoabsidia padenii]
MLPSTCQASAPMSMMAPPARSMAPLSYQYRQDPSYGLSMPTWDRSSLDSTNNNTLDHPDSFTSILRSNDPTDLPSGSCSPVPGTIAPMMTSDGNDLYLVNHPYDYSLPSSRPLNQSNHSNYLYSSQPPRLASITTSPNEYDTFARKSMIKTTTAISSTYPHSPPHDDEEEEEEQVKYKPNTLSHIPPTSSILSHSTSHWYAKAPGYPYDNKDDAGSNGRKRSSISSDISPTHTVKRVRALNH